MPRCYGKKGQSTTEQEKIDFDRGIEKYFSRQDRWNTYIKLSNVGINAPLSYILECSYIDYIEFCCAYNDILKDKRIKRRLSEVLEDGSR